MKDTRYAFCVAKIRALETKMLTKNDISALIGQKDLDSALDFLVRLGYAEDGETIKEIVSRQSQHLNEILHESVPDKKELNSLYILNDYFNVKVFVKCAIENTSPESLVSYPTTIDFTGFNKNTSGKLFDFMKDEYRFVAEKAYTVALRGENGKFSDAIVDKEAINALCDVSASLKKGIFARICAFLADTANIKIALRCAATSQDADYINEAIGNCCKLNRTKLINCAVVGVEELVHYISSTDYKSGVEVYINKPSSFEKWCDDKIIEITSEALYNAFGFGPVVSYFYRKNIEIKTVRMILNAIKSEVDKKIVAERVRNIYA